MAVLQIGDEAPDFDLPGLIAGVKKRFRLSEQRGRNIILAFYPFNWEPVSDKQMVGFQAERDSFLERNAEVVGICVESIMNTTVWERDIGPFDFPLCSDFWPHGEVAQKYGVLRKAEPALGSSERVIFVIDRDGRIVFRRVYGMAELPEVADMFSTLQQV